MPSVILTVEPAEIPIPPPRIYTLVVKGEAADMQQLGRGLRLAFQDPTNSDTGRVVAKKLYDHVDSAWQRPIGTGK